MLLSIFFCTLFLIAGSFAGSDPSEFPDSLQSVTFLLAINNTEEGCVYTVKSPPIRPNTHRNKSQSFSVGDCDHGPLTYTITTELALDGKEKVDTYLTLTWYSSVIEDASPPTCRILWNYSYEVPHEEGSMNSLLPGCYIEDSREGFHMTYYWFYIFDWFMG